MKTVARAIEDFCNETGYEFYAEYSGRFMWGRTCVGIVCENPLETIIRLTQYLTTEFEDEVVDLLGEIRQDEMGLSKIIYFPGIE